MVSFNKSAYLYLFISFVNIDFNFVQWLFCFSSVSLQILYLTVVWFT